MGIISMKVKLEDMTWPEVDEVLKGPNAMILPVGSIEQHSLHLPLSVDFRCAEYIAWEAAKKITEEYKIRVLVAPAVRYAEYEQFKRFPGTIGIALNTFMQVIEDIVWCFANQGFKNIIIVNGHGPNRAPLATVLQRTVMMLREANIPDVGLYGVNWWDLGTEIIESIRKSESGLHADEMETACSLVIQPENVKLEKALEWFPSYSLSNKWVGGPPDLSTRFPAKVFFHSRKIFPKGPGDPVQAEGVMGDPTVATKEIGEKMISAIVDDFVKIIVEAVRSEKE